MSNVANEEASAPPLPDVVVDEMLNSFEDAKTAEAQRLVEELKKEREEARKSSPPTYDEAQAAEANSLVAGLELKADGVKKEVRERLDQAKRVKEEAGESLYNSLFGMLVQDCVDSILKKEVVHLTAEMCLFRRNISEKMTADESRADQPMNIMRLPEGFGEAWRLWRAGDTEEAKATRGEASYEALVTALSKE